MDFYKIVRQFQQAWNNLGVSEIENSLHENFEYGSQMVLSNIYGRGNYLEYLKAKFLAIKNAGDNIVAQIGKYNNQYCLLITQQENDLVNSKVILRKGVLLLKFNEGLMSKAHMCSITPTEQNIEIIS
jgi:hypothetical protein